MINKLINQQQEVQRLPVLGAEVEWLPVLEAEVEWLPVLEAEVEWLVGGAALVPGVPQRAP